MLHTAMSLVCEKWEQLACTWRKFPTSGQIELLKAHTHIYCLDCCFVQWAPLLLLILHARYTIIQLLQLSLNSGRALELLLESQKLFSLLLSVIKTQHLAKLKMKLYNAESARSKRLDTPTSVGAIDQCTSDSIQPQGGTTSQPLGGTNPHPLGGTASQPLGGTTCTSPDEQLEDLSVLTTACVRCCNPYVVSGWCQLVTNLLQAFPDLLSSYVHNYCVVASLTR